MTLDDLRKLANYPVDQPYEFPNAQAEIRWAVQEIERLERDNADRVVDEAVSHKRIASLEAALDYASRWAWIRRERVDGALADIIERLDAARRGEA